MHRIWSRGELLYKQQTASFGLQHYYTICIDKEKVGITTELLSEQILADSKMQALTVVQICIGFSQLISHSVWQR